MKSCFDAAKDGDEIYFDQWYKTMKHNGYSSAMIKHEIEKLDQNQSSVLHYAIRYSHWNLVRRLIEDFCCGM